MQTNDHAPQTVEVGLTQSARQTMLFAQRNPNCSIVEAGEPAQDASQVEAVSAFQISDMY